MSIEDQEVNTDYYFNNYDVGDRETSIIYEGGNNYYQTTDASLRGIAYPESHLDKMLYGNAISRVAGGVSRGTQKASSGASRSSGISSGESAANIPTTLPAMQVPSYTSPERDENRLSALRSKAAGAPMREIRRPLQQAIMASRGYPGQVARMTLREALAGYGGAVSKVMAQAEKTAESQYEREFSDKVRESQLNYQAQLQAAQAKYQGELALMLAAINKGKYSGTTTAIGPANVYGG